MASSTKDVDKGHKRIRSLMARMRNAEVTVGFHDDAGDYPDGTSVLDVAFWNEFGTVNSPARPAIKTSVDSNRGKIFNKVSETMNDVILGKTSLKRGFDSIGFFGQLLVQNQIKNSRSWAVPNAPSTVRQKLRGGAVFGATPLIASTLMLRSVTFQTRIT